MTYNVKARFLRDASLRRRRIQINYEDDDTT
jgi:hypothetical protein